MEKNYNEDCFAFKKVGRKCECHALIELNCKNCRFYKLKSEVKNNPFYAQSFKNPVEHKAAMKKKNIKEDQVLWN